MTLKQRIEQQDIKLREKEKELHELRCRYGDLADAVNEILFDWKQKKTVDFRWIEGLKNIYEQQHA